MDQIIGLIQKLQSDIHDRLRSTPGAAPEHRFRPELEKINDSVYSVHSLPEGKRPSVEIVFCHGLQLQESHDTHIVSWVSRDPSRPELWLEWILEYHPDARILLILYDAHVRKTDEEGRMDMHLTTENLILDLIVGARVGHDGCPVVLVGHCLGGLVMKELCVQAQVRVALRKKDKINNAVQNFLVNVQGFFCYASPHHGSRLADDSTFSEGPLFKGLTTLNTEAARRNEDFRTLRQKYEWRTFGIGETRQVNLGSFKGLIVEEASARHDVDTYRSDDADHFDISRPQSRTSSSFLLLKDFVSEVVEEDKSRQGPTLRIPEHVVGLETQLDLIRERLMVKKELMVKEQRRLGIVGMGGIGKTTLAKAVFNAISGFFEYTCFLEEAKRIYPESLRAKITGNLSFRGRRVPETFRWGHLRGRRVLIVLDDVTDVSQLLVITEDECLTSHESAVIVTARDSGFLIPEDFEFHFVEMLEYEESKKLFCKHAFKNTKIRYEPLVERVLEKCDGLPLALEVAGRYLYKRCEELWVDALKRLGSLPLNGKAEERLTSILNMSYESLAQTEKEMFLDVAADCFRGLTLSTMKRTWEKCGFKSFVTGWQNLLDRGLIKAVLVPQWWRVEGDSRYVIRMHEMLRDLGQNKGSVDPQIVSDGSLRYQGIPPILKIVFNDLRVDIFQEADGLRNLCPHSGRLSSADQSVPNLRLSLKTTHLQRWISQELISQHQTLRSLEIKQCVYLLFLPRSLGQLGTLEHLKIANCSNLEDLPEAIGLLSELKHLSIHECDSLSALPESLGELQTLQRLTIQGCCNLETLPESLGELQTLQRLTIQGCCNLETLPESLWKLCALEILTVTECHKLKAFPRQLGELPVLKLLEISGCSSLLTLPVSIHLLPSLERLTIERCHCLEALPRQLGKLAVLKELKISDCGLHTLPKSIHLLPSLERLTLEGCHSLEALPLQLGKLAVLKNLTISDCYSLRTLPETIHLLLALERLTVQGCPSLVALPESLGHLPTLEHLTIESCHGLKTLPESLGHLPAAEHLTIERCDSLETLPESLGHLAGRGYLRIISCPGLKFLPLIFGLIQVPERVTIQDCHSLKFLPFWQHSDLSEHTLLSVVSVQSLEHLTIQGSEVLQHPPESIEDPRAVKCVTIYGYEYCEHLPESLGQLESLEHLTIRGCIDMKHLPESLGNLRALQHLTIAKCGRLKHLPESLGQLETLKYLTIQECGFIEDLPESLGNLQALQHLTIVGCVSLEHLPESLGQLETLKHLTIQWCSPIKDLPESLGNLRALQHLTIADCWTLEHLPESLGQLESLEHLTIRGCSDMKHLPKSLGNLQALQHLTIAQCLSLERLPESCGQLESLEHLTIRGCSDMKDLPKSLGNLRALKHLTISGNELVFHLPESLGQLESLEHLTIRGCNNMEDLPKSLGNLRALQHLHIEDGESLEHLPESLVQLETLEHLTIKGCKCLKDLPKNMENLRALKRLTIEKCDSIELPGPCLSLTGCLGLENLTVRNCKNLEDSQRPLEKRGSHSIRRKVGPE